MFSRYPDQARSRRGYALTGVLFLMFSVFMALIGSVEGTLVGFVFSCTLFLPAILFSDSRLKKYESAILFAHWNGLKPALNQNLIAMHIMRTPRKPNGRI